MPPFKLANSIVSIPGKLVKRIKALEFVKTRELLPDNIAMAERLATLPLGLAPPKPVTDMLAYMHLVIREASKFGETGWLTYDSVRP